MVELDRAPSTDGKHSRCRGVLRQVNTFCLGRRTCDRGLVQMAPGDTPRPVALEYHGSAPHGAAARTIGLRLAVGYDRAAESRGNLAQRIDLDAQAGTLAVTLRAACRERRDRMPRRAA